MGKTYIKNGYRIKISRHRTHVTTYEDMILQTTQPIKKDKPKEIKPTIPSDYKAFNYYNRMKKRRKDIREICYNNFELPNVVLLTLTFDPVKAQQEGKNYMDLTEAHYAFKKFIQRVNSHYKDFRYIAVFSRQSNGNWHYHVFCNFSSDITNDKIKFLWKQGITYINYIHTQMEYKQNMDYMIENMQSSANELEGRKGFLTSKNIERDKVYSSWNEDDTDAFDEAFERVSNSKRTILYECKNHLGIKGKTIDEETGEISEYHIEEREINPTLENAGYEDWSTIYTHLSSSADFSDKFSELTPATLKQKKKKHKHILSNGNS